MYGAEGTVFLKTIARQRSSTKQLTTLRTYNKNSTFIITLPSRSRKLYATLNIAGSNIKDQQQSPNNCFAPLARISSHGWSIHSIKRQQYQQLRFKTATASLELTGSETGTRILYFAEHHDPIAVISEFKAIKQLDIPLTTEIYQAVIKAYGTLLGTKDTRMHMADMMNVYNEMVTRGVRPTSEIYAHIIRSLCVREEHVNRATNTIRRQMDLNTHVTEAIKQLHPISIDNLVKARSSLSALESENNLQQAVTIFEQAVTENKTEAFDVQLYNNLLRGLSYIGNAQDGLFVYEQLENGQVQPNSTTFAMLFSLFGKAGDIQAVKECFKEYKNVCRTLPGHDRGYIYNALVSAYVSAGDLEGALHLVETTMVDGFLPVTILPYNKILYRAYVDNNIELVSQLAEKLKSNDQLPNPDVNTYGILLSAYSRSRNLDKAHEVFEKVMTMNLDRQYGHLNEYVAACVDENELGRSMDVIRSMYAHGMRLHVNQCCNVVNSYLDAGDMRGAADAVKEITQLQSKIQYIDHTSPLTMLCRDVIQRTDSLVDALDILRVLNMYSIRLGARESIPVLKLYDEAKVDPVKWNEFVDYCTEGSYNVLYEAALRAQHDIYGFRHMIYKLLEDMHDLNIQPNHRLYVRVGIQMNRLGTVEDKTRWEKTFGDYYPDIQNEAAQQLSTSTSTSTSSTTTTASSSPSAGAATTTTTTLSDHVTVDIRTSEALNLVLSGNFDKALVLMKKNIIELGMVPNPGMVCNMIMEASKSNRLKTATDVYNMVLGPFNQLETKARRKAMQLLNNNMMIIHSRKKDAEATKMYYDKLRSDGVYPNCDGYAALLHCYDSNGYKTDKTLDPMMVFEEAKKHNGKPSLYLYNVAISKLGKCQKLNQALALFNELQEIGDVHPNSMTYNSVITACLRSDSETQAVRYFDAMTNHTPKTQHQIGAYNAMMQYYVRKRGDRETALVYFEKLKQTPLVPSIHTYRLLMEAYANIPDYDMVAACNLLTDMKKQFGLNAVASHYATLIHSYGCVHQDVAAAETMFDKMTRAGIKSTEHVYRALVATYIRNANMPKAEALYKTMVDDTKVQSSPSIENLFIEGYGESGDVDKAEQVFNRMTDEQQSGDGSDVVREPDTYKAMVTVYMNDGQADKANQVLDRMKQCGFPIKMVDGVSLLIEQGQA